MARNPAYMDPNVIKQRWIDHPNTGKRYSPQAFYDYFGDNTFRKILRSIFSCPCTYEQLKGFCENEQKLNGYLIFLQEQEIVLQDGDVWKKDPQYKQVSDIGATLEWYVGEWFRFWLEVPARHGVTVKGLADGGDLDVVAFVEGKRIMIECKSGNPANIGEAQLRFFLQRAKEFGPEIAILLIDTEGTIEKPIDIMNSLQATGDRLSSQDDHNNMYWGMRHIYVTNTRKSIGRSLSAVLRLYNSKIKYLSFWG